jgi:hypothetical protein
MAFNVRALLRLVPFVAVVALLVSAFASGCGRSDLLADSITIDGGGTTDSGGDGGTKCGPSTCPTGCCDPSGICRNGTDTQACGEFGAKCTDCLGLGFDSCDPMTKACSKLTPNCDATTCPFGCCTTDGTGNQFCVGGTDPSQCGASGAQCADCTQFGDLCDQGSRTCVPPGCNAKNCPDGCCTGDVCQHGGKSDTACGFGGITCDDCAARGQTCSVDKTGNAVCVGMPACGPQNCKGCCIGDVCVGGGDNTACGLGGGACQNCAGKNQVCDGKGTCAVATCGPANCPGCCQGNACVLMTSTAACGKGGAACAPCPANDSCTGGTCVPNATCDATSCPTGCCTNGICAIGTQPTVCGNGGASCQNCSAQGLTCTNQACAKPVCGPTNCAGCCSNGVCVLGNQDMACGNGGGACTDCTGTGLVCGAGGACKQPCGPGNCAAGCCNGQSCVGGFLDNRCGSGGAACSDCTAMGATCDTGATPRACTAPNTCPSKYPGCGAGVTTAKLTPHQNQCAASDLQDAPAACTGGPNSAACQAYLAFLQANSPGCATCLTPFLHDFSQNDYQGIFSCIAAFVGNGCNHTTGCETDCETQSCAMCAPGDQTACLNTVDGQAGQCFSFVQASQCIDNAISNPPGDACDPFLAKYNFGDFGLFLQGMGQLYCQP